MRYTDFISSINNSRYEDNLPVELKALWLDKNGCWNKAHELIQHLSGSNFAYIHAYLHRKEGDLWNAQYWYSQAGSKIPNISLEEEWSILAQKFCE